MKISVDLIKTIPLFAKLSESDIIASLNIFKLVEPEESDYVIFKEGGVGDSLFIVIRGQVEIQKIIDAELGTKKILAVLEPGSFFGEMALLTGETRSASAVLKGNGGILIKIDRSDFMDFMASTPIVASSLLGCLVSSLSDRLRNTSTEVVTLYETGRIIGQSSNFNEIVFHILDRMIKVTKASAGFVMMWNEVVGCFECKAAIPEFPPIPVLNFDSELAQYWQKLDVPVTSAISDSFVDTSELGFKIPSVMYTPLIVKQEDPTQEYKRVKVVTGVSVLVSPEPNAFSMQYLNLSRSVAEQVSQAIANTRFIMENEARRQHEQIFVTADI